MKVKFFGALIAREALAHLSQEALTILETFRRYEQMYCANPELQDLDCSPLVATMFKVCERVLADFLDPKCRMIQNQSVIISLLSRPGCALSIPPEDQRFSVDRGSVRKVLSILARHGAVHWCGTRNCAIALLLFGRAYRIGDGPTDEIRNPLNLFGDADERTALRVDLYQLQQMRNGFIHHDLAGWGQVQQVKECFKRCLRRLATVLFGVSGS